MTDIMTKEASTVDLKDLVRKFIPNSIGTQIKQACQSIYPLKDVYIRKVKRSRHRSSTSPSSWKSRQRLRIFQRPRARPGRGTKLDRPNDGL